MKENEINHLLIFRRYKYSLNARHYKSPNKRELLQGMKWGFPQHFLASMIENNIKPKFNNIRDEIQYWARRYPEALKALKEIRKLRSPESNLKRSLKMKGRIVSEETRKRMSEARFGMKFPDGYKKRQE